MLQNDQVLSLFRPRRNGGDWSQAELAEFYRVEAALVNSGISICSERGISDEGDPWFVFCRQDNEEVIVHFARIDGEYLIVSNLADGMVRGRNFNSLIRELLSNHPYVLPKANPRRQTVYLHPATLLAALIVTGYVKSAEVNMGSDDRSGEKGFGPFFNGHSLATFSALIIATVWDALIADPIHKLTNLSWFDEANAVLDHFAQTHAPHEDASIDSVSPDVFGHSSPDLSHQIAALSAPLADQPLGSSENYNDKIQDDMQLKTLGNQPLSFHSNENASPSAELDASSSHKGGDGKPEETDSLGQRQSANAETKLSALDVQNPAPSTADSHASSTPTPAVQTEVGSDAVSALSIVSHVLHLDFQAVHPFASTASTLSQAVQTTLSELKQSASATPSSPVTTGAPAAPDVKEKSAAADLVSSTAVHAFDDSAQHEIESFFNQTPNWKIESFGHDILVVDTNLSHYGSNSFGLETWAMPDGSTISILGQAAHHG